MRPRRNFARDIRELREQLAEMRARLDALTEVDFKSRAKAGADAVSQVHASSVLAVEPVSRPAAGRTAAATVEPMTVTAGETAPNPETAAVRFPTGDRAGVGHEQAPEGTSGGAAAQIMGPANARSPAHLLATEPAAPDDDEPVDLGDDDDAAMEFGTALERVQARRFASTVRKPARTDWARVAAAHAALPLGQETRALARALAAALSPEECRRCGIPGRKGCAHQAPFVPDPIPAAALRRHANADRAADLREDKRHDAAHRRTGGIQAVRL